MIPRLRSVRSLPGQVSLGELGDLQLNMPGQQTLTDAAKAIGEFEAVADLFAQERLHLGLACQSDVVLGGGHAKSFLFEVTAKNKAGDDFAEEEYELDIEAQQVKIRARSARGLFYATRTLLSAAGADGILDCCSISDAPRYRWRGAHLDVSRHFFETSFIKRFIDLLALHKINVFHWHLTDDQGWRVEIDAFPQLQAVAAFRTAEGTRYGGYYTKEAIREIVAYAKERFIEVVPEIELPGHAVSTLAAYPELSCGGGSFEVETKWGIFKDVYCAGKEDVFDFLETVLDEVIELFPSNFLHIGGDECPKDRWKNCSDCQERMKTEGLTSEEELQSYFVSRMSRFLSKRGKRLVGWDEILEGGLADGATVMSWRGIEGGIRAAEMGHDVVMSPTSHCYLDYKQAEGDDEPGAWFAPALDLETTYSYEPTPVSLSPSGAEHILGVQGNIWTERMPTEAQVEYMAFPRLCALSEVGWASKARDFAEFQTRLFKHLQLLDRYGVRYRGSKIATPLKPTEAEIAQYKAAAKVRAEGESEAAYT